MKKNTQEVLQSMLPTDKITSQKPYKLKLRNWLNGIFILLAIATITLYFVYPLPEGTLALFATGCTAVLIKTAEVTIRMTHKHTKK